VSVSGVAPETSSLELPRSTARRYLIFGLKLLVSLGLLWLLVSRIEIGRVWSLTRQASAAWILVALGAYLVSVLISVWRWRRLLLITHVRVSRRSLCGSFLTALFFNNFLPSNVGGDVIRIRDTARPAGSSTVATTVVLADRIIGLLGLFLFAAFAATMSATSGGIGSLPLSPQWIWAGFAAGTAVPVLIILAPFDVRKTLQGLGILRHGRLAELIETLGLTLAKFRSSPGGLASCFSAAVLVQISNVAFYVAVAYALRVDVAPWALAIIVPVSSLVQAVPISVNGFGVREATFSVMFARLGLPIESALAVSLVSATLIMLFSLSGAGVYVTRQRQDDLARRSDHSLFERLAES
jgi:uncharacterized protein (TIRG00374 family)